MNVNHNLFTNHWLTMGNSRDPDTWVEGFMMFNLFSPLIMFLYCNFLTIHPLVDKLCFEPYKLYLVSSMFSLRLSDFWPKCKAALLRWLAGTGWCAQHSDIQSVSQWTSQEEDLFSIT